MSTALLAFVALAACGSKATPPATTPTPPPVTDTHPVETKPAEPPPKPDPEKVKAEALALETAAYEKAKPVFERACANCHSKAGKKATAKKLKHFDMTTYPFGGAHTKSIGNEIRVVLAIDGTKKATMPDDSPGSLAGDDLAVIKAWTEAWRVAGAAGAHPAEPADQDDD